MKRMHLPLAISAVIVFAPAARAQVVAAKLDHRIAVVNIGVVFTQYEKAKAFKASNESTIKPYKDQADRIKAQIEKIKLQLDNPSTEAGTKARLEEETIKAKRRLEDLDREVRAKIGKNQEEHLVRLYKEVTDGVKEYADKHGILVVFGYGEPPTEAEWFTLTNINRKLTGMDAGGTVPLYVHASVDISQQVTDLLNRAYLKRSASSDPPSSRQREPNDSRTGTSPRRNED